MSHLQWDVIDADIMVPSAENSVPSKVLFLKPGAGQNTALHTLPTPRSAVFLISVFPVRSSSVCPCAVPTLSDTCCEQWTTPVIWCEWVLMRPSQWTGDRIWSISWSFSQLLGSLVPASTSTETAWHQTSLENAGSDSFVCVSPVSPCQPLNALHFATVKLMR